MSHLEAKNKCGGNVRKDMNGMLQYSIDYMERGAHTVTEKIED
jgi:hypothetical protein